ncbi:MAG TPA: TA system VapC family ribonuclease toxin [Usitatibacter sp.]|nr:TA system VapC family ribonuclease toxin [Usitatibacter sp.]
MRALLDVNVLVALFDANHSLHAPAMRWFEEHGDGGWASCPITQNGCIRVMSQPSYPERMPVLNLVERLRQATHHRAHEFWPDDASLLDEDIIDATRIHGPGQLTDVYLLALAVSHGGRLVTLDQAIPFAAVRGAQKKHVVVI